MKITVSLEATPDAQPVASLRSDHIEWLMLELLQGRAVVALDGPQGARLLRQIRDLLSQTWDEKKNSSL